MQKSDSEAILVTTRIEGKYQANIICFIFGLGSLFSWNVLVSVGDYFYAVFPDYHPERVISLVYMPFAFGTMGILSYNEARIDTRKRVLFGYTTFALSSFGILLIDLATSGKGGLGSFIGICIFCSTSGIAGAFIEGGMVGDLSFMCPQFAQMFFIGLGAAGALASVLRVITKASFNETSNGLRKGFLLFIGILTIFQITCIVLYAFIFPKLPIVKHFHEKAASQGSKTVMANLASTGVDTNIVKVDDSNRLSNKELLIKNIDYEFAIFLSYTITFSIFPGFLYENTGRNNLGSWFALILVVCINVWDLIGRYIPLIATLRLESRKGLMIATVSRLLLIPCFYYTAKYGNLGWMIALVSFLGLTKGYLTICLTTAAPKGFKAPEQNAIGNFSMFFLLGGTLSGVLFGLLWMIEKS